jgi:hypothetical protein
MNTCLEATSQLGARYSLFMLLFIFNEKRLTDSIDDAKNLKPLQEICTWKFDYG